jgi:hypothetical protein
MGPFLSANCVSPVVVLLKAADFGYPDKNFSCPDKRFRAPYPLSEFALFLGVSNMPSKRNQHVVPNGGDWAVKGAGAKRATEVLPTKREAVQRGREISRNQGTELFIHGQDGKIQSRDSHGKDPFPPKG